MPRSSPTEPRLSDLIARARQGDAAALTALYERYRSRVQAYVAGIVRDPHDAEDVTQQVFVKLPGALRRYEERPASFLTWLLRVARNVALDDLRARRRVLSEDGEPAGAWSDGADLERGACLREALAELPHDQRRIVLMRHVLGLTPEEIAGRLGKSEGSINAMHHRARVGLRRRLRERGLAPATAR